MLCRTNDRLICLFICLRYSFDFTTCSWDKIYDELYISVRWNTWQFFWKDIRKVTDYRDIFGYQIQFGPGDHKGVSESLLSVVEGGKWKTLATAISY